MSNESGQWRHQAESSGKVHAERQGSIEESNQRKSECNTLQDSEVCGKRMSGKLKVKIYKTSIRPVLLHRTEMRTL